MKPLTILHTIETSGPGGAENVLLTLATGLDPARFRSIVAINDTGWLEERLIELSLPYQRICWRHWYDFKLIRNLARIVKDEGVDVIHSHLPDQNFYSCIAGRLTGCPTIATYHGVVELADAGKWRNLVKLTTVRWTASNTSVVCDRVRDMLKNLGFSPSKLTRIYNGIRPEQYANAADGRLRRELNIAPEAPIIGMVANVRSSKGHEFFIRAARLVADRWPGAGFVISGDLHEELAPPLFRLIDELGLQENVTFLGFRRDVPKLLGEIDIFVLPSTSEGFPLVVLEAMAASRPVIATRCGGVEELVEHGVNGILVPVGEPEAMARQICALLSEPESASALGVAGRRRVIEKFSVDAMLGNYERLYEQCAQSVPIVAREQVRV